MSTNVSYCYHEILSANDPGAFFKYIAPFPNQKYVGSADTNAVSFCKTQRLNGPMILVHRDKKKVIDSIHKAFVKHEAFTDDEWKCYINNTVDMFEIIMKWYEEKENPRIVDYDALNDAETLSEIFNYLVPAHSPDMGYVKHMNNLVITIKNEKGMRNGIEQSRKNCGFSIKEFKKRHLKRYDHDRFKENFYKQGKEPDYRLQYGAATMTPSVIAAGR